MCFHTPSATAFNTFDNSPEPNQFNGLDVVKVRCKKRTANAVSTQSRGGGFTDRGPCRRRVAGAQSRSQDTTRRPHSRTQIPPAQACRRVARRDGADPGRASDPRVFDEPPRTVPRQPGYVTAARKIPGAQIALAQIVSILKTTRRPCPDPTNLASDNVLNHSNGSQNYPLDLIERDLVVSAIVELGRACAFMRGHLLGIFQ